MTSRSLGNGPRRSLSGLPPLDEILHLHVASSDLCAAAYALSDPKARSKAKVACFKQYEDLTDLARGLPGHQGCLQFFAFGYANAAGRRDVLEPGLLRQYMKLIDGLPAAIWLMSELEAAMKSLRGNAHCPPHLFKARVIHALTGALLWFYVQSDPASSYVLHKDRRAVRRALRAAETLLSLREPLGLPPLLVHPLIDLQLWLGTYTAGRQHLDKYFPHRWFLRVLVNALHDFVGEPDARAVQSLCEIIDYDPGQKLLYSTLETERARKRKT